MASEKVKYLATVECHFKWKPDQEDMMPEDIKVMEEKVLKNIDENPNIEIFALTLLSYIFTKGSGRGRGIDYKKAIQYASDARLKSTCRGEQLVAIANTLNIYHLTRKTREFNGLYHTMMETQKHLTEDDNSRVMLTHGFALTRFGMKAYPKAVDIYRQVLQLTSDDPDAHFGLGMILGRIRRYKFATNSKPSEEELGALAKACHLRANKDAFSVVWYGYGKVQSLLFDKKSKNLAPSRYDLTETAALFDTAMTLADSYKAGSCVVYKWCAKGYKRLCQLRPPHNFYKTYVSQQRKCIDKAVKANPTDSSALHEAGIFYWRVKCYKDTEKAKQYLQMASNNSPSGNFWADVDLVHFLKECDPLYDVIENYTVLLSKYEECESGMESQLHTAYLHMLIGKELMRQKGDRESTIAEFVQAIELDKNLQHVKEAKKEVMSMLQGELETIASHKGEKRNIQVSLLLQLGHVSYITKEFHKAKHYYEEVLTVDGENSTAKERLCEIHFTLKNYDACVQMGCSVVKTLPTVKEYVAKSYYRLGEPHFECDFNTSKGLLWKSAELGLLEAGQKLLGNMKVECADSKRMSITKSFYEECAKITHLFSGTVQAVSLSEEANTASFDRMLVEEKELCKASCDLIMAEQDPSFLHPALYEQLTKTRKKRFEMTLKKMSVGSATCMDVLSEARCQLDGCFFTFKKSRQEYQNVNKRGYYPFTPKAKIPPSESEENLQETIPFMKQKLEVDMKLVNFSTLVPELFDFLCKRQARYSSKYDFVPEFCRIVNEKKHESKVDEQDWYYDLAHKACVHVEELAIELSKYMQSS